MPPGANIDNIRDFYKVATHTGGMKHFNCNWFPFKSSQYRSMYALPPSPSRPAPVLERAPSASTLTRNRPLVHDRPHMNSRSNRVSVSEGELTDDAARLDRHVRANR